MAVCDVQYCFTLIDIGDYGRNSQSKFDQVMKSGSPSILEPEIFLIQQERYHVFEGDTVFPLRTCMTRPYLRGFLEETVRFLTTTYEPVI